MFQPYIQTFVKCYIVKSSQGCIALHNHWEGYDGNPTLLQCGSFSSHNREQEKVPTYQHLCLTDTAHLYVVCLLNTTVDPFITSPSFPPSHPCWRHQVSLIHLKSCCYLYITWIRGQKLYWGAMVKNIPLWQTIFDKIFLNEIVAFFYTAWVQ